MPKTFPYAKLPHPACSNFRITTSASIFIYCKPCPHHTESLGRWNGKEGNITENSHSHNLFSLTERNLNPNGLRWEAKKYHFLILPSHAFQVSPGLLRYLGKRTWPHLLTLLNICLSERDWRQTEGGAPSTLRPSPIKSQPSLTTPEHGWRDEETVTPARPSGAASLLLFRVNYAADARWVCFELKLLSTFEHFELRQSPEATV